MQFPLSNVVIATDAMPTHWAFYFQGSGLPSSVSGPWSGSICRDHIALQELHTIAMMLYRMAFHLFGKVVALHLDNSTVKAYLCNQGGTVSPFLSRLACCILSMTDKHVSTLTPAYISTHLNVEAKYLSWDWMLQEWHLVPQVAQAAFHLWGLPEVDLLSSSHSTQCQDYYTLETALSLGSLGLNAFNHPWTFQVSYVFHPPALFPLVLSKFLADHVKGQLRHLILVTQCWMEAPWLPTVLNMLADVPWQYLIIKDPIMDVSIGHVLKGLKYLHLTLWLLSDVCYADGFSSSVCQAVVGSTWVSTSKVYQQCWKEWASWCAQQGVPSNAISAPKLANFSLYLFQVGLARHTIGIYRSAISTFLEPHCLHKACNHPVISKLIYHFYLQHPPYHKHFDLVMLSICYLC